ncbi:MAG TPA: hypothetical protein VLC53_11200, partial [Myxococcota bacterium]|nr:hypothetical protein [Myxococcota bacterium]
AAALAAAAWRAPELAREPWTRELYAEARPFALAGAVALLAGIAAGSLLLRRSRRQPALAVVAIGVVAMAAGGLGAFGQMAPRQSGKAVAIAMRAHLVAGTRLYSVGMYDQTVPFYLGRTLRLAGYVDEFEKGLETQPGLQVPLGDFPAEWLRPGEALAIIHPDTFRALRQRELPMQLLHEDPRRVLVRKP